MNGARTPLKFEISATADAICGARQRVADYAAACGVDDPLAVKLAVSEAVTAAVMHSSAADPGVIRIDAGYSQSGCLIVRIEDETGRGAGHAQPVGFGFSLMLTFCERVSFEQLADDGVRVEMQFA